MYPLIGSRRPEDYGTDNWGEPMSQGKGDRQYPLTDRHLRKDMIHQVRRRVGHAPPAAGRTKTPAFAGIRHEPVQSTGIAVHPQKPKGQDVTLQERMQFSFHEPGHAAIPAALPLQEGLEMSGDYLIKNGVFRIARTVFVRHFRDS